MESNKFTSYGWVDEEGGLHIYDRRGFLKNARFFSGQKVQITVEERSNELGNNIRSYYFAVVVKEFQAALKMSGVILDLESVDLLLRNLFLSVEYYDEDEERFVKIPHTLRKGETRVSSKMMSRFIEQCIITASEYLDWQIPYPNERG